jgi:hypothetical protein
VSNTVRTIHGVTLEQATTPNERAEGFRAAVERCPDCPYLLVRLAIVSLLLQDDSVDVELKEVERLLQRAFELDPSDLDALEELANFYHATLPNEEQAKAFARQFVRRTARAHIYMRDILGEEYDRIMNDGSHELFPYSG